MFKKYNVITSITNTILKIISLKSYVRLTFFKLSSKS